MEREPVISSTIASVGYGAASETLEIEFNNTGIYQYKDVPQFIWEQLMSAKSLGKFFNVEIKNSFSCTRV